jgi:hypothetical protein
VSFAALGRRRGAVKLPFFGGEFHIMASFLVNMAACVVVVVFRARQPAFDSPDNVTVAIAKN